MVSWGFVSTTLQVLQSNHLSTVEAETVQYEPTLNEARWLGPIGIGLGLSEIIEPEKIKNNTIINNKKTSQKIKNVHTLWCRAFIGYRVKQGKKKTFFWCGQALEQRIVMTPCKEELNILKSFYLSFGLVKCLLVILYHNGKLWTTCWSV